MAYGRPVVATRVGGLVDLSDGVVYVEPRDAIALGDAIRALLDDPSRRAASVTRDARPLRPSAKPALHERSWAVYAAALSV